MSKYGNLSRTDGHSKWFLQRTLAEHDRSMDHPWMQMVYKQCFTVKQYAAWLARNHAVFAVLEELVKPETLPEVHDPRLLRTAALEADLRQLLGATWREQAVEMAQGSPSTQRYLGTLKEDASSNFLLLAHHFLQYNAVLSGGAYLGKMVSQKLCLVRGAPGVAFYHFVGVDEGKESARVQQYLKAFDKVSMTEEDRDAMLAVMQRIYTDTEATMQEVYELNPVAGVSYGQAKDSAVESSPPPPSPEQLELLLSELHSYKGTDGGRILFSLAGELLDVSAGSEIYAPGGGYSLLAGHDVTRCLATMSLDEAELDDLAWEPDNAEEEKALALWREKLKAKYPVAGRLVKPTAAEEENAGLRRRTTAAPSTAPAAPVAPPDVTPGAGKDGQKCPISGKEGAGCPMSAFGIGPSKGKAAAPKAKAGALATTGFMAGKSLVASVEKASCSEDWWLSRLCPLHWDAQTARTFAIIAALCWLNGAFAGWFGRRLMVG